MDVMLPAVAIQVCTLANISGSGVVLILLAVWLKMYKKSTVTKNILNMWVVVA